MVTHPECASLLPGYENGLEEASRTPGNHVVTTPVRKPFRRANGPDII